MLTVSGSIILGVLSGVLTSSIVWAMASIFQKIILPWYQSVSYQGIKIDGAWIGYYGTTSVPHNTEDPDYTVIIEQKGHNVEGSLRRNKTRQGKRDVKDFIFRKGIFRDGNLVFSYKPQDETRLGLGTYVMKLADDGRKFEGKSLYVASNSTGTVAEFSVVWIRQPE